MAPPSFIQQFGNSFLLWFEPSNSYIILDGQNKQLLDIYLKTKGSADLFTDQVDQLNRYSSEEIKAYFIEVSTLVKQCNQKISYNDVKSDTSFPLAQNNIHIAYTYGTSVFGIQYPSEKVKQLVHPQIAHLATVLTDNIDTTFNIILEDDILYLLRENVLCGAFHKNEYHLLQGKFAMELICLLTHTSEKDWLGTFHASTITNGDEAIMLIGDSGNGKSTLSALLMANGFQLVADDITPILAKDKHIYSFPAAISIKQGAFDVIKPTIKDFDTYPNSMLSPSKGQIKHIPYLNKTDIINHYPCRKIVSIKYVNNAETQLISSSIASNLSTLIPDSWISPHPEHARGFIDWLQTVDQYQLTYSNTEEAINVFHNLFEA